MGEDTYTSRRNIIVNYTGFLMADLAKLGNGHDERYSRSIKDSLAVLRTNAPLGIGQLETTVENYMFLVKSNPVQAKDYFQDITGSVETYRNMN